MNVELQYEITNFLHHEAYLLDHRKYKEWLDLLAEDLVYCMPMRQTTERKDGSDLVYDMTFFDETKMSLTTRVHRLYTKSAWVEDPPPRQRHFISNIMISPGPGAEEYSVRSYFHYTRSIGFRIDTETLSGEREDVLRKKNGTWEIASRTIFPDQAVLGLRNLSMFL